MLSFISVFIGGGVGSALRWLCCSLIPNHWGTMIVNIAGAFFIGMAYSYFAQTTNFTPETKLFIMTGLLGGFTTFSTYLLNFMTLVNNHNMVEAFLYLISSVLVGCLCLIAGMKLAA